jgi:hypothetical protein
MSLRLGLGDEIWRLAGAGDAAGLEHASELLADDGEFDYESRRALAFRYALDGRTDQALAELNEGWAEDWPPPAAYALDVARIHLLAGDCERALSALQLEVRGLSHWSGVSEVVAACVRRHPRTWRRGLGLALAAETGLVGKLRAAAIVARARFGGRERPPEALPDPSPGS